MRINIHAGHNPDGKVASGAVGLIKESTEARNVVRFLMEKLQKRGHTVYDCTVDDGISQGDVLKKIVAKCNKNVVDLDISIHFNAGVNDFIGNNISTGTECYVYNGNSKAAVFGEKICKEISKLGYRNRGVKISQGLYFLNSTKAQAILVECCFVDDKDDVELYNAEKMAEAISNAIGVAEGFDYVTGEDFLIIDGEEIPVRRILKNGTNYIAIRDIATALGYKVSNKGNTAILDKIE